ncbi:SIR2 family protein [Novosphingobium kaempferiae]|uniref:SIR2 family protein n=1 Tax=Novosphingobium kaempferiae TaxID=2896849 RepID=UPI001E4145A9|nr:SIR2 family protein [Novosphingobium kaempferiae]
MRFVENGPILPDELLISRDEGQVLFFCGSGVSLARAGLPDFYGLADAVLKHLHAASNSRARAVIAASRSVSVKGVEGLIPADRAFSLLEQEFDVQRVREAVAASLVPKIDDISAHRALMDLATGTDGVVRLVTTNFDRLFQQCSAATPWHSPPDLPNPARASAFKGIMHLHGVLDADGRPPVEDNFVISSADFGRAYLSDGWATRFIRSLMERFQIVFVGYTANDPPVQYLLEALNTRSATFQPMYALQAGDDELAKALWSHKGVTPIAFDPANNYRALWDTIEAWAERARDPQAWARTYLAKFDKGPQTVKPHERGIFAHLASYPGGSREIAKAGAALPAEWMCVLDPSMRYRTPAKRSIMSDGDTFDPFAAWGLDDEEVPPSVDPDNRFEDRKTPVEARNLLVAGRRDETSSGHMGDLGLALDGAERLPERLRLIGSWFTQVAHEPAALWWAAGKARINQQLAGWISSNLDRDKDRFSDVIRRGWRDLIEGNAAATDTHNIALYRLEQSVSADGWTPTLVRKLAALRAPRVEVRRSWTRGAPPTSAASDDLLHRDIAYPNAAIDFIVPEALLPQYVRELGHVLQRAVDLETELRAYIYMLGPLWREEKSEDDLSDIGDDLTGLFRDWVTALERLLPLDVRTVRAELSRWVDRDNSVGRRLRIWAAGMPDLWSAGEAARELLALDEDGFWERDHQRDLLCTLSKRLASLPETDRKAVEQRVLAGPSIYDGETPESHRMRAAAHTLERLAWLNGNGVTFTFNLASEMARLRALYPAWEERQSQAAAESNEARVVTVGEKTDHDELLALPIRKIAEVASSVDYTRLDTATVLRSFLGLVRAKPVRALAALRQAGMPTPLRLWEEYLTDEDRTQTSPRLVVATACLLVDMASDDLLEISRSVARWIERYGMSLKTKDPPLEARLWELLLGAMESAPDKVRSAVIVSADNRDWLLEAINSPSGRLADYIVHRASDEAPEGALPHTWLGRLRRLIDLAGDAGRYALVTTCQNLKFLYFRAPAFAGDHLLPKRFGDEGDRTAFWSGVVRSSALSAGLHRILNAEILETVRNGDGGRGEISALAAFLLRGWAMDPLRESGDAITDDALREAILETSEGMRRQILQTTRRWWKEPSWQGRALELLRDIWPRQRIARSASVADAIASLVVESDDKFPETLAVAGDLLEPLPGMAAGWSYNVDRLKSLAERFPEAMLDFLYSVLVEDAGNWPYRIEITLEALETTVVQKDGRLQDLRRRWSARTL